MIDVSLRALGRGSGPVEGVTTWCWSDHAGLHLAEDPPEHDVPTGYVWGWGPGVWVRWRTDPFAPAVGAEVRLSPGLQDYTAGRGIRTPPSTPPQLDGASVPCVVAEPRFLRVATGTPAAERLRGRPLGILQILEPTQLVFFDLDRPDA